MNDKPLYFQGKWWFISDDREYFKIWEEMGIYPIKVYYPRSNIFWYTLDWNSFKACL